MRRIAVITESINIEDSSGSKANVALIKNLQKVGYDISVFHYTRMDIKLDNINCYNIREKKFNLLYLLSRVQRLIQRHFKINLANNLEKIFGFSFTFFNDINSIKGFVSAHLISDTDLIITLSKGASFRPHYAMLQLPELHHKWLAYVHDPYPFHCYPEPYRYFQSGYKLKADFFKAVSEKSKYAAFPSLLLKEWMGQYFPNFLNTGIVIPHQSLDTFNISKIELPSYFDRKKFNLLHAGSLLNERSPEGLIKGYQLFLKEHPEAKNISKLLLLGNANCHVDMLKKFMFEMPQLYCSLKNVVYNIVNELQNNVSVNIILEAKSDMSPFLPGKFPHCVMANKPILLLGPQKSESKRLLGDDYSFYSEADDVIKIAEVISEIYTDWKKLGAHNLLNRDDLKEYVSAKNLKNIISALK